jgi:transposase
VELPAHLERREQVIACPADELHCPHCQKEKSLIGYETAEQLDVEPAVYFVRVIKREKRACHDCPEGGVSTAPCPARIIPKGKLADQFVIDLILRKFDEHLPVYRQCAVLERDFGIELSRQTLVDAMLKVGDLLEPVRRVLAEDLKAGGYIQADETPVPCQSERTPGRNHQAYMWEYSRPAGPVVFDFRMGRQRDGPRAFLKGFVGKLQTDGYGGYDHLGEGIIHGGCMSHARRGFHKAHLLAKEDPLPLEVLGEMARLYQVEEEARASQMTFEQRLALRQQRSRPVMANLKERTVAIRKDVLPQSALGKACDYALRQWKRLCLFLEDGQVEIDNNRCENAIRPIALGRKNWLHIGSEQAGPKIAAIISVMETCRRLGLNVRDYFNDVLPKLADWPVTRVSELTPIHWPPVRTH